MSLSYDEFMNYKTVNLSMPVEVNEFMKTLTAMKIPQQQTKTNPWRKVDRVSNNWLVQMKFNQDADDKLFSHFRSILNKISGSNFDKLAEELINLQIKQQHHLEKLVEIIFTKAITENNFSSMYAKLSKGLASYYIEGEDNKKIFFRELLINRCQQMFTQAISLEKDTELGQPDAFFKYKEQVTGCMVFIGELYLHELLTNKIINSCFSLLFAKVVLKKLYIVDSLCVLMKTIGKIFYTKCPSDGKLLTEKLDKLKSGDTLQMKDKFAIMDILDQIKKEKWVN